MKPTRLPCSGSFNNYVDWILPPLRGNFYSLSVDKNRHFLTSSPPRSYWMTSYGSLWCGLGLFTQIGHCVRAHTPPTILENVGHYIKYKDKDVTLYTCDSQRYQCQKRFHCTLLHLLITSTSWVLEMHWKYMGNKIQWKVVFSKINIQGVPLIWKHIQL